MPSLMELLESDLGAGETKTASQNYSPSAGDDVSIEKIATQLGLFGSTEKVAESKEEKKEEKREEKEEHEEKKASLTGVEGLFNALFPGDALGGTAKTASDEQITKEAADEQAVGARTYDHFAARFDQRIEKLAYAALSGDASAQHDPEAPNHLPNNKPERDAGGHAVDTTPHYTNEIKPENSKAVVGREGSGGNVKAAALRKQLLLAALQG